MALISPAGGTGAAAEVVAFTSVASPTGTSSTTAVMMGLAATIAPTSTRLLVTISGNTRVSVGTAACTWQVAFGTGGPPANGAAATGTTVGSTQTELNPSANIDCPFSKTVIITGLTGGTTYWVDLQFKAVGAATASCNNVDIALRG